jgi:hypothetical protein
MSTPAPKRLSLLGLPAELRLHIYHYVAADIVVTNRRVTLPSMLAVCKSVREEMKDVCFDWLTDFAVDASSPSDCPVWLGDHSYTDASDEWVQDAICCRIGQYHMAKQVGGMIKFSTV